MTTPTKAKHDRLRDQGAADFAAGKPIDTFETLPGIRRSELERGSYEVGWRGAKEDARKAVTGAVLRDRVPQRSSPAFSHGEQGPTGRRGTRPYLTPADRGYEVELAERYNFALWFDSPAFERSGHPLNEQIRVAWAAWRARALL